MSYYDKNIKCMYHIADGVLYYHSIATRKVYSRQMIPEIDRIINTLRPVAWRDGCKRFDKIIYENELVSINRYVIGRDKEFTIEPPYPKGQEIIRYHGEVPNLDAEGKPVKNPTYASPEYERYLRERKKYDEQPEAVKARRRKRLEYLKEYQRRKRQQNKSKSNNKKN